MKDTLAQNFAIKHEIGWRFQIDPDDLPAPFATGLANPRRLLVLPNGDVVVAEQSQGY